MDWFCSYVVVARGSKSEWLDGVGSVSVIAGSTSGYGRVGSTGDIVGGTSKWFDGVGIVSVDGMLRSGGL
jgi:hypothetical protein